MRRFLPQTIWLHWSVEFVRQRLKRCSSFELPEIGLSMPMGPRDIVLDCGANIGKMTSRFARTGATVYAFEPNPHCFKILRRRFRYCRNVKIINAAILDRACRMTLHVPAAYGLYDTLSASEAGSLDAEVRRLTNDVRQIEVECLDVCDLVRKLRHIRLLKLDIEGAEIAVTNALVSHGLTHLIDLVAMETHERQMPHLREATAAMKALIQREGLSDKVRFDWP